jgi:ribonuclease P protein component
LIGRIHGRTAFERLARSGRSFRTGTLWCRFVNDPQASPLRVGFSVARSYGRAVERNRLRRRLRVIVAEAAPSHGLTAGWLLIGARPSAKEHTFDQLQAEVHRLLRRVESGPA